MAMTAHPIHRGTRPRLLIALAVAALLAALTAITAAASAEPPVTGVSANWHAT